MGRLFDSLKDEVRHRGSALLPVHRDELNFCLRGCYASMARLKFQYRKTEAHVSCAENIATAVSEKFQRKAPAMNAAWETVLFNSFHDILPGSSIERAYDDQIAALGGAFHAAQVVANDALNTLAAGIDTRVPAPGKSDRPTAVAILVFNPNPHEYRGPLEFEAHLDYRPIWSFRDKADQFPVEVRGPDRKPIAFQSIHAESCFIRAIPWRKRVATQVALPPMGWSLFEIEWKDKPGTPPSTSPATAPRAGEIDNGFYKVIAKKGAAGLRILHKGKQVLGGTGLHFITVDDPWGSWGDMGEKPENMNLSAVLYRWKVTSVDTVQSGPEKAELWVRLDGGHSKLELRFALYRKRDAVDVSARLLWNERSARLKMVMPAGDKAEFDVLGAAIRRGQSGEVPGSRWVMVRGTRGSFGFASDALYCFDCTKGALRATLVRASRFADDKKADAKTEPWRPATDQGEHRFQFVISPGGENLRRLAVELERPLINVPVAPHAGNLPRAGSLMTVGPEGIALLALKPAEDGRGVIVRLQNASGRKAAPALTWLRKRMKLEQLVPWQIGTWRLTRTAGGWKAVRTSITEN